MPSSCSMVCEIKIPFTLCVSFNDFLPVASRAFNFFDLSEIVERFPICLKKVDLKEKISKGGSNRLNPSLGSAFLIRASDVRVGSCSGSAFFDRFP